MYVLFLCLHMLHIRRNNNNTRTYLQIAATVMATKQTMCVANNKVKQTSNHPTDRLPNNRFVNQPTNQNNKNQQAIATARSVECL